MYDYESTDPIIFFPFMNKMGYRFSEQTLNNTNVQQLLKSNQKFDAVIIQLFKNDAFFGFAHHFNAPLILFSNAGVTNWINPLVANPAPPSYVADAGLNYASRMTFFQRLRNFIYIIADSLNTHFIFNPKINEIYRKYFPNGPELNELRYNVSLVLANSDLSMNEPAPRVPAIVDVGGFHLKPPQKLPADLQEFLDNAKDGVVYFSMGSNLKSADLPQEKKDALLKAFSKLKQKVLWKWEEDTLPNQPANVKIGKWLPQQEILAHPNVKLFITHGGYLSSTETVYHGKPILCLPILGDQKSNAARAVINGYALIVPFSEITEERITNTLNELLYNPKYFDNAQQRSRIMKDQLVSAKERIVYWVEYVIRHKGAPHLKVTGLELPLYQYLMLDVIAFIVLIIVGVIYLIKLAVKTVLHKIKKSSKAKNKSKSKENKKTD